MFGQKGGCLSSELRHFVCAVVVADTLLASPGNVKKCIMKGSLKMLRRILFSTAVVLLLSSGVFASIGQVQGFSIDALNRAKVNGGFGFASGQNYLEFGQTQEKHDVCIGSASASQGGILSQQAHAGGMGRLNSVRQNASVAGVQNQLMTGGRYGSRTQGQSLTLNLNTNAFKTGGFGCVDGTQSFAGGQNQMQTYRGGFGMSSQSVYADQSVKIIGGGGRCSNAGVNNNLDVRMFQGNIAR
jgi:hypothetical protein